MRILELNFEKHWRGGERQTIYNIQGFAKSGHKVTCLCRSGSPLEANALKHGIIVIGIKSNIALLPYLFIHARKYDILHCQTSNMLTWCLLSKWWHKKPVILSRRVSYVPRGYFTLLKYRLTTKVIAISNAVKTILSDQGIQNIHVIGDVVIPVELNRQRALTFIHKYKFSNKKIIATMAAFEPEKDPMTMVKAISALYAIRQDFVFFHFGTGKLLEEVRSLVIAAGLQDVYYTPGFMQDVTDFFSLIDVFVFSSIDEGSGSSILDAFIYKVPVASTNAGGLKDLVTASRGLTSPVKDAHQLALNVNTLLMNKTLTDKFVESAYEYAITNHNLDTITSQYIAEFNSIIKKTN